MTARVLAVAVMLVAAFVLGGCDNNKEPTFQGWIEADMIFVGPDETGRIETLSVREGDQVDLRAPLFTLDPDLQLADVAMQEATVKNAQQAYDRAMTLMKTRPAPRRPSRTPKPRCAPRRPGSTRRRRG